MDYAQPHQASSSTTMLATPSTAAASSCAVDALERVMHFTGAGADACFYANPSAGIPPGSLGYWLNPSVRIQHSIATCEILNAGPPFFSAVSSAELRISASPLFKDGRCFPTRCVLSLATSTQRLDALSVRPVVVQEWALEAGDSGNGVYSTTVPLRTLYHVASLMGCSSGSSSSSSGEMDRVRLYLQLRFDGCTDASDTHRIAAIHLRYEGLGPADVVLPMLQRRRASLSKEGSDGGGGSSVLLPHGGLHATPWPMHLQATPLQQQQHRSVQSRPHEGTFVEEVEVTVTSSASDDASEVVEVVPYTPLQRRERCIVVRAGAGDDKGSSSSECASPPHRSATKPRDDPPPSVERRRRGGGAGDGVGAAATATATTTHAGLHSHVRVLGGHDQDDGEVDLLRVERTLRLPPQPPVPSTGSSASGVGGNERTAAGAPWPPRKTRTIVLAPSVTPSLTSSTTASASDGDGSFLPGIGSGSTPHSRHSSRSSSASSATICEATPPSKGSAVEFVAEDGQQQQLQHDGRHAARCAASPSPSPPPPQRDDRRRSAAVQVRDGSSHSTASSALSHRGHGWEQASSERRAESASQTTPQLSGQASSSSGSALLWQATSLLGTAPWKLKSLQASRRGSPSGSARSSRASSQDRSRHEHARLSEAQHKTLSQSFFCAKTSFSSEAAPAVVGGTNWLLPLRTRDTTQPSQRPAPAAAARVDASFAAPFSSWRRRDTAGREAAAVAVAKEAQEPATLSFSPAWPWRTQAAHVSPRLHPPWPRTAVTPHGASSSTTAAAVSALERSAVTRSQPVSAYVPRLRLQGGQHQQQQHQQQQHQQQQHQQQQHQEQQPAEGSRVLGSVDVNTSFTMPAAPWKAAALLPPPSQNKELWAKRSVRAASTAAPHTAHTAQENRESRLGEHGGLQQRQQQQQHAQGEASANSTVTSPFFADEAPAGPLSVIPSSWLHSRAAAASTSSTQHVYSQEVNSREEKARDPRRATETGARAAATVKLSTPGSTALTSPAETSLSDTSHIAPPPSAPPPRRRALFHDPTQAAATRAAAAERRAVDTPRPPSPRQRQSRSPPRVLVTQRNDTEDVEPALPLQEPSCRRAPRNDGEKPGNQERRSRSAPPTLAERTVVERRPTPPSRHEAAPSTVSGAARSFAVWKHHASRSGVGRRRLTVRTVGPALGSQGQAEAAGVRAFLALEKVSAPSQLRATLGHTLAGNRREPSAGCEVPLLDGDAVEVWTGAQAYQSGVIHKDKVRNAECCLVVRCNRQLVTALEMESVEDTDTVYRLLMN